MNVILKYSLTGAEVQTVLIMKDAKILNIAYQRGDLKLWALGDPTVGTEPRRVLAIGTNHITPTQVKLNELRYLKTMVLHKGAAVLHFFVDYDKPSTGEGD